MSFLIFDVDHSLASIGGDLAAAKVSSIKPIKVTNGSSQVTDILSRLFEKKVAKYEHPLLSGEMKVSFFDKSDLAKSNELEGIVKEIILKRLLAGDQILSYRNCSNV